MRFKVAIANEQRKKRYDRRYLAALERLEEVIADQEFWDNMSSCGLSVQKIAKVKGLKDNKVIPIRREGTLFPR